MFVRAGLSVFAILTKWVARTLLAVSNGVNAGCVCMCVGRCKAWGSRWQCLEARPHSPSAQYRYTDLQSIVKSTLPSCRRFSIAMQSHHVRAGQRPWELQMWWLKFVWALSDVW